MLMANSTHTTQRARREESDLEFVCRVVKKRFRKFIHQKAPAFILAGVVFGMLMGLFCGIRISNYAKQNSMNDYGRRKTFTTYTVREGDTIWGIAEDLAALNPEYNDIRQYVADIEEANHIYGGTIKAGQHILIPYYISQDGTVSHDELYGRYGIGR